MHDVMSIGKKSAIVQSVYQYEAPNNGPVVLGNLPNNRYFDAAMFGNKRAHRNKFSKQLFTISIFCHFLLTILGCSSREPCFNGGTCEDGICSCPDDYDPDSRCYSKPGKAINIHFCFFYLVKIISTIVYL